MFGSAVQTCSLILYRPRKASGSMAEAAEVAASRPAPKASPGSSADAASMPADQRVQVEVAAWRHQRVGDGVGGAVAPGIAV